MNGMAGDAGGAPMMWCPRHDRTYAHRATCPRCRTPLVRIDPPAPRTARAFAPAPAPAFAPAQAEPAAEIVLPGDDAASAPGDQDLAAIPAVRRRYRVPVTVGAAIALAFAIGVSLPDRATPSAPAGDRGATVLEARPMTVAAIAGVAMRLERVSQRGQRVEVSVRVLRGLAVPDLREAFLEVVLADGSRIEVDDGSVRAGRSRFSVTFLLPSADSTMRHLRITGLRTSRNEPAVRLVASIAGSWPVAARVQPRVIHAGVRPPPGSDPGVIWDSTILWRDRVEVVLDVSEFQRDAKRFFGSVELFEHDGVGEPLPASFTGAREDGSRVHLDFVGVRDGARRLVLFLGRPTAVLDGPWAWSLQTAHFRSTGAAMDSCSEDLSKQRHPCP